MKKSSLLKYVLAGFLTCVLFFICGGLVEASANTTYPEVKLYARFNGDYTEYESSLKVTDGNASALNAYPIAHLCSAEAYMWNIWDSQCTITSISTYPAGFSNCVTLADNKVSVKTKAECESLHPDDFNEYISIGYVNFDIICDITIAEAAYPQTTFTVTIDQKDYTYIFPAGTAAKWPKVTKEQLLSGATNGGKSVSELYTGVTLTKTTPQDNSSYRYSNDTTSICFGSDALSLAFTATGTLKNGSGNGGSGNGGSGSEPEEPEEPTGKATFTIIPEYGTAYSGKTYSYTPASDSFLRKNDTITLEDIINGATRKVNDQTESFVTSDNTANMWIINTSNGKSKSFGINAQDGILSYDPKTGAYKLIADLTEDRSVTIYLAPAKVLITFVPKPVDDIFEGYSAVFEVTNNSRTQLKLSDIAAGFKKETEVEGEFEYLSEQVIVGGLTADYTKAYSGLTYTVDISEIRTTDLDPVTNVQLADKFTENTCYDPDTDSLCFESPVNFTLYWTDAKKSAGVQLKGDKVNTLSMKKVTTDKGTFFTASIPLNDKENGLKIAENKTAYVYVSTNAPAEGKAKYTPNYVVDATPYKKIAVTFAYAQAEKNNTEVLGIATVTTTDTKKKTITYSGDYDEEKNPDHFLEYIIDALQYSADGVEWLNVAEDDHLVNGKTVNNTFTSGKLYDLISSGSKTNLFFRIKGHEAMEEIEAKAEDDPKTRGFDESVGQPAKNAWRASKAVKVGVAAAKTGKVLKIDVSKGTIALKNGYDFAMTNTDKTEPSIENAITILPYNKAGKATTEIRVDGELTTVVTDTIDTFSYFPVAKVTENDTMFTSIKVTCYSIEKLAEMCGEDYFGTGNLYLWVRKSATAKNPADQWTLITIPRVADAPTVKTDKAGYYTAQDPEDVKGVIACPEVSNAKSDKTSGAYEYLIVDAADIKMVEGVLCVNIDMTTAKWTTLTDKGVTVAKSKSKYANEEGKKATDHVLKDGSVILIRRAGDKSSGILASDYVMTTIVKQDVTYKDADNKDQTKALYVWKEFAQAAE